VEARPTQSDSGTRISNGIQAQRRFKLWLPLTVGVTLLIVAGALIWRHVNPGRNGEPNPTPAPLTDRLSYWMMVQKYRNGRPFETPFRLAGEINFESDYHVRLHVTNRHSGFLYIINEGPNQTNGLPDYVLLFPSPTANQGSAQLAADQQIAIPERGDGFVFDREQGAEKLWLVWSASPAPEIENLKGVANPKDRGAITDPTQIRVVRDWLAKNDQPSNLAVEKDERNNQTNLKGRGDMLVYRIKLEHH
jgi:hypothetical protein